MTDPQPPIPTIACPACGNLFKWKPNLAGRKLKCRCGALVRMPKEPSGRAAIEQPRGPAVEADEEPELPVLEEDSAYELELTESEKKLPLVAPAAPPDPEPVPIAPVRHANRCPSCGSTVKPGAVVCVNCGFNFAEGKTLETETAIAIDAPPVAPTRPTDTEVARLNQMVAQVVREKKRLEEIDRQAERKHRFQEYYIPLMLLAGGFVAVIIGGILLADTWWKGLLFAAGLAAIEIFVMMPLLLLAAFLSAKLADVGFGSLDTAILKLAAICLGPGTVADLLMIPIMSIIAMSMFTGMFVVFALYLFFLGVPMARLFDLDMHEASVTIAIAIVIRAVVLVFGFSLVAGFLHP